MRDVSTRTSSAKGAAPGELIFISGHPGSTSRQDTMAQLLVERDIVDPSVTEYLKRRIASRMAEGVTIKEQQQSKCNCDDAGDCHFILSAPPGRSLYLSQT